MKLASISTIGWAVGSAFIFSINYPKSPSETALVRRVNGFQGNSEPKELTVPKPAVKPKPEEISDHAPHRGGDTSDAKDRDINEVIRDEPAYEKGYDYWHGGKRPDKGVAGLYKDEENKVLEVYYGRETKYHGLNAAYCAKANGLDETQGIHLKKTSGDKKEQQRHDSLRYLKKPGAGIVLDEKPPASVEHDNWYHTVVKVPDGESRTEGQMFKRYDEAYKEDSDYTVKYFDHRDDETKAEMKRDLDSGRIQILLGPKVDGYPEPKHITKTFVSGISRPENKDDRDRSRSPTIVDAKGRSDRQRSPRKRDVIQEIQSQEGDHQDPSVGYKKEINSYIDAMDVVRNNVSDLIWPVIETMLAFSNSSLVHGAAFSLYSDLTMAPVSVMSPFRGGMHSLDQYEDSLQKSGASDTTMNFVYAMDEILIELYQTAWDNATALANTTGLLNDLAILADYLSPKDRTLLPDGYDAVDVNTVDQFEVFVPSEDRYVNLTTLNSYISAIWSNFTGPMTGK